MTKPKEQRRSIENSRISLLQIASKLSRQRWTLESALLLQNYLLWREIPIICSFGRPSINSLLSRFLDLFPDLLDTGRVKSCPARVTCVPSVVESAVVCGRISGRVEVDTARVECDTARVETSWFQIFSSISPESCKIRINLQQYHILKIFNEIQLN